MQQPQPHDAAKVQKLQERDPDVELIKAQSKFAVAYYLHQDTQKPGWRKANLEGPVYIVQRKTEPRYQLWCLHEQSNGATGTTEPLVDNICAAWELDCQKNYVFYKVEDASEKIRGLWFHDDLERQRMEGALEALLTEIREKKDEDNRPGKAGGDGHVPAQMVASGVVQDQLYSQFGLRSTEQAASEDKVVITKASLRQALHALVDDDNFLNSVMSKLKDKSPQ